MKISQIVGIFSGYKTQKRRNSGESKERKFEKNKRNRMSFFNIYIVVFGFLSSNVEGDRW